MRPSSVLTVCLSIHPPISPCVLLHLFMSIHQIFVAVSVFCFIWKMKSIIWRLFVSMAFYINPRLEVRPSLHRYTNTVWYLLWGVNMSLRYGFPHSNTHIHANKMNNSDAELCTYTQKSVSRLSVCELLTSELWWIKLQLPGFACMVVFLCVSRAEHNKWLRLARGHFYTGETEKQEKSTTDLCVCVCVSLYVGKWGRDGQSEPVCQWVKVM